MNWPGAFALVAAVFITGCGKCESGDAPPWLETELSEERVLRGSAILNAFNTFECGAGQGQASSSSWLLSEIPSVHRDTVSFQEFFRGPAPVTASVRELGFGETIEIPPAAFLICPLAPQQYSNEDLVRLWNREVPGGPDAPCLEIEANIDARIDARITSDAPAARGIPVGSMRHFAGADCAQRVDSEECLERFCSFNCL